MSDKSNGKKRIPADWKRPAGPLNVWRIVEGQEKLASGETRTIRFSIQDIPEDRYIEAAEHMCKYFTADEATCKSLKMREDPVGLDDFRILWNFLLKQGISVAAYKLDSDDKSSELVALNVLFVVTEEIEKVLEGYTRNFKSQNARTIFKFMNDISQNVDTCAIFGVDTYMSALGLSVAPSYRGQKLGVRLLEARTDIGRKYGIYATATIFTALPSQIQAERAGFETALTQDYAEVKDKDGNQLFPGITSKSLKIMIKSLR